MKNDSDKDEHDNFEEDGELTEEQLKQEQIDEKRFDEGEFAQNKLSDDEIEAMHIKIMDEAKESERRAIETNAKYRVMSKWVQPEPFDYIINSITETLFKVDDKERLNIMKRVREYLEHYWSKAYSSSPIVNDPKIEEDEEKQERKFKEIKAKYKGRKKIDINEVLNSEPSPNKSDEYLNDPFNYITYNINLALFTVNLRSGIDNDYEEKSKIIEKVKRYVELYH